MSILAPTGQIDNRHGRAYLVRYGDGIEGRFFESWMQPWILDAEALYRAEDERAAEAGRLLRASLFPPDGEPLPDQAYTPESVQAAVRRRARAEAVAMIAMGALIAAACTGLLFVTFLLLAAVNLQPIGAGWLIPMLVGLTMIARGAWLFLAANASLVARPLQPEGPWILPTRGWIAATDSVGVLRSPDPDSAAFESLAPGTQLDVLEIAGAFALIRVDRVFEKLRGWVPQETLIVPARPTAKMTGPGGFVST